MRTTVARLAGLGLAATVALGGAAADSASAKVALKLQANGETLGVGAPMVAASSNFEINSLGGAGKVTCQDTSLNGKVEKNGTTLAATAVFEEITFAGEGEEGQCVSTYAPPLHHTNVELISGLPLRLTLNPKGEAILKPVTAVKPGIEIGLRPLEPHKTGEAASCFYSKASWIGGTYTHDGGALVVTMPATAFRLYNLSGLNCHGQGARVSATFTFSSSGFPVDSSIG
jgi:hypothetical protein